MNLQVKTDAGQTPAWAEKIDRWYQLDEISFAFCEALHQWNYLKDQKPPDKIILALRGACNTSDFDFVDSKANSPSKFVFTLPNICASIIFQLLQLEGQVFCFHQGPRTFEFSKSEAREWAKTGQRVWLFTSEADPTNRVRHVSFENITP